MGTAPQAEYFYWPYFGSLPEKLEGVVVWAWRGGGGVGLEVHSLLFQHWGGQTLMGWGGGG